MDRRTVGSVICQREADEDAVNRPCRIGGCKRGRGTGVPPVFLGQDAQATSRHCGRLTVEIVSALGLTVFLRSPFLRVRRQSAHMKLLALLAATAFAFTLTGCQTAPKKGGECCGSGCEMEKHAKKH